MKTITQSRPISIPGSITNYKKLSDHLFKPLKAGLVGFVTILILILLVNLVSYIIGINEKMGMDILDLLLAGLGFILQTAGALLKSFVR
jgi:hypothetical protein